MDEIMGRTSLKRCLFVSIIFLFLSTISVPVFACEGKPDFVIVNISPYCHDIPVATHVACWVVDIGNATAYGSITIDASITWMFLGRVPIVQLRSFHYNEDYDYGFPTGVKIPFQFAPISKIPKFGCFRFDCTVNPNKTIEESNYSNNDCTVTYFITSRESMLTGWHLRN
jgi:hypothetical protein